MKKSNISVTKEIVNAKKVGSRIKLNQLLKRKSFMIIDGRSLNSTWWASTTPETKSYTTTSGMITSSTTDDLLLSNNTVNTSSMMIKTANYAISTSAFTSSDQINRDSEIIGTNEQVKNVHEGDLVKTDGSRIFYIPKNALILYIVNVEKSEAIFLENVISLKNKITDMYITGSKIILIGTMKSENTTNCLTSTGSTVYYANSPYSYEIGVVEVRDIITTEVIYNLETKSKISSHRLINDSLFITTNKGTPVTEEEELRPFVYENNLKCFVPYSNIYYFSETLYEEISVLISINLKTNKSNSIAFLGDFYKNIYMNEDSLFMVSRENSENYGKRTVSRVIKFDVNATDAELIYCATGIVDGLILNQYAMDEFNGMFRVVTTFVPWWETAVRDQKNRLFILKEDEKKDTLKYVTSIVSGIGKRGETIKSARFSENMVYITTFLKTDPIYTIDLTDIHYPIFKSEIEEDGYSSYMHEWGPNELIGVGYAATPSGIIIGSKISAYKTDGTKKQPVSSLIFEKRFNFVRDSFLENPKELLIVPNKGFIGFSMKNDLGLYKSENFFLIISVDFNRKDEVLKKEVGINHGNVTVDRGLYINGIIYTLSENELISYDYEKKEIKDTLPLGTSGLMRLMKF